MPEIDTDRLYEIAFNELKLNRVEKGLWARAFAESDGDQEKAKARYIKERVNQIQKNIGQKQHKAKAETQSAQVKNQPSYDQASLLTIFGLASGKPTYISKKIIPLTTLLLTAIVLFFRGIITRMVAPRKLSRKVLQTHHLFITEI